MSPRSIRRVACALAGTLALTILATGPIAAREGDRPHHAAPRVTVLAHGLDNPRGIAVTRDGGVLVALAGRGGTGADGFGLTGKVIEIRSGRVRTVLGRLPSVISEEGASGPVGVAATGEGNVFAVIGAGPQPTDKRFSTLMRLRNNREHRGGSGRIVADIAAYQLTDPKPPVDGQPADQPTDSDPYGVAAIGDGRVLVADAGGNDLLMVSPKGRIKTVARFPNQLVSTSHIPPGAIPFPLPPEISAEAVPTSIAVGPDGYWYVGELKGFPFTPGTSRIWRIAPSARDVTCDPTATSGKCTLFMDGFSSIVGLSFGRDGSLYVVEMVKNGLAGFFFGSDSVGALWRVRHGTKTELVPGRLTLPGGVAAGRDGAIYVTNKSVSVGGGEVLRIRP